MFVRVNNEILNLADVTRAVFRERDADQKAELVLTLRSLNYPVAVYGHVATAVMAALCEQTVMQFGTDVSLMEEGMFPSSTEEFMTKLITKED